MSPWTQEGTDEVKCDPAIEQIAKAEATEIPTRFGKSKVSSAFGKKKVLVTQVTMSRKHEGEAPCLMKKMK